MGRNDTEAVAQTENPRRISMTIAALLLAVAGVLSIACALGGPSFDFAIAITKGWHVTVFPPPVFVGVLTMLLGIVMFVASLLRR